MTMDVTHSSKIAWNLVKKLNCHPKEQKLLCNLIAYQVATELLSNTKAVNLRIRSYSYLITTEKTAIS